MLKKDKIIKELGLTSFGAKGWMSSPKLKCQICGRDDKFGILFSDKGGIVNCFYEPGEAYPLRKYLKEIGREDLIDTKFEVESSESLFSLEDLKEKEEVEELLEPEEKKLPVGFKRIYYDDYLEERGFTPEQYNLFGVGKAEKYPLLKGYLIFTLKQEGKVVGWLARSKKSKEWHDENLRKVKEEDEELALRYRNSRKTDFELILGGYDEIIEGETKEVILVEGLFDKANIDRILSLYSSKNTKCCFTFGNSISDYQIYLLNKKKVERVILLYDYGTIKQIKGYGATLDSNFQLMIGEFKDKDIDAGDASKEYIDEIMNNLKNFYYFYKNRL